MHFLHRFRPGMLTPVLQLGLQLEQPQTRIDDLREGLARRIVSLARSFVEGLGKPGNHLGIDRVVLGEPSGRSGEAANALRIDDPNLDLGVTQRLGPLALVAAARLHHRLADLPPAEPRCQFAATFGCGCKCAPQRQRTNADIHLVLGDIDSRDNEIILCHHPAPFLARFGLQAHATVRVEEDTGPVPRSPAGSMAFEHERAQIQRRAVGENRPFAHSDRFCGHKSTKETVKTIARGKPGYFRCTRGDYRVLTTNAQGLRVQRAPGFPCALCLRGAKFMHSSGASRREIERAYLSALEIDSKMRAACVRNALARNSLSRSIFLAPESK